MELAEHRLTRYRGLLAEYNSHLRRRGLAITSREVYGVMLRGFIAEYDPLTATTDDLDNWLDSRQLSPSTRRHYISCLKGFFGWACEAHPDEFPVNPAEKLIRPRAPKRYPRPIDTDLLAKAIQQAPTRMKAWLTLAAYGGLRCKEIAGLKVEDIRLDVDPPVLHLRDTKGDKDRVVPLADEVAAALAEYDLPGSGFVFPALTLEGKRTTRRIGPGYVSESINRYLHNLGIPATAHQLRHWFGTELYRRTLNPLLVRDLMGHADLATTSLYMALTPSEAATQAVKSLSATE